ncbi:MAG TPA: hypothetical protein LFW20_01845 [Rickettsia endosymbiont of Omalisus fontisbellaquei]|nr:hypothetical protein [Rickettsia endosymbiont of Omalisus fontisbellaquei]
MNVNTIHSTGNNFSFMNFSKIDSLPNSKKSYIPINGYLFEHILNSSELSSLEKLYYLIAISLSHINDSKGKPRAVGLSAKSWAKRLNCSKSTIFPLQKNLVDKGLFLVSKEKNQKGQNSKNLITPILPEQLRHLNNLSDNIVSNYYGTGIKDKANFFIKLNYHLLKLISSHESLTPLQKIIWLDFYSRYYKSFIKAKGQGDIYFIDSYLELMNKFRVSKSTLSKSLSSLEKIGFIKRERFSIIKEENNQKQLNSRADYSLWKFTISLPNLPNEKEENITDYFNVSFDVSSIDPTISKFSQQYKEKNSVIKKERISKENTDNKDESSQILNYSSKNLSKSYKNNCLERKNEVLQEFTKGIKNSDFRVLTNKTIAKNKNLNETFKDYHPLNEEQIAKLQIMSGREFSGNFINQLLLKFAKDYSDYVFPTENHFMAYMSKALRNELHQAPQVNHDSFKFSVNIGTFEQNERKKDKEIEEYLLEIENKNTTDKLTQLQKKITGEFEKEEAYKILKNCEFNINKENDKSKIEKKIEKTDQTTEKTMEEIVKEMLNKETGHNIRVKLSNGIKLTKQQQETLQKQIFSVYEISEIKFERVYEREKRKEVNIQKEKNQEKTTGWDRIKEEMIRQIDETVNIWLSKLEAEEDKLTKTLKLRTPNSYIKDRVEKDYGSYIYKYGKVAGFKEIIIVSN